MSGLYSQGFSPARNLSPQIRSNPDVDSQYLAELLAEHQKLGPFMQVLPICNKLLSQEIMRVSSIVHNHGFGDYDRHRFRSPSPMSSPNPRANLPGNGFSPWSGLQESHSELIWKLHARCTGTCLHALRCVMCVCFVTNIDKTYAFALRTIQKRLGFPQRTSMDWQGAPPSPSTQVVKKILRLEVPVDSYPNFNFVGRILGPRGNSLKRVEASTGCRVFIRGNGSIKDPGKEDKLRGKPGYEHLSDPLHILIEAEFPASIIDARLRHAQEIIEELLKPVDESQDFYKRQQLRELALLNSTLREDSPHPGSVSPFSNGGMKRAKTGQ
ncbi:hypothetical protein Zm00014a_034309 [Zea mays]|uniref:K Homology domain-containing protein n=2 Tax=Zea mays TaxID=4577 RepID=A0A3L6EHC5_MAIZE|nr:KH domain-containing protein SPIN1 [Zea mays]PWZ20200.1 hypothetical protein Zm00014a_034309 [Zea mays]